MLRISTITTCLNIVDYVDATIRSVVSQTDPDLEYIVIDGGSTDGTLERLHQYSRAITQLIVTPGLGQYQAIQQGLNASTGEIMSWINADDIYFPWTLEVVREIFTEFPDIDWLIGMPTHLNRFGHLVRSGGQVPAYPLGWIRSGLYQHKFAGCLQQESMFWRRRLWDKAGGCLDLSLAHAADFELWTRFAQHAPLVATSVPLAAFRHRRGEQKSSVFLDRYDDEVRRVCTLLPKPPLLWRLTAPANPNSRWICTVLAMMHWQRSPMIQYSLQAERYLLLDVRRPASPRSLSSAVCELATRRSS